MLEIKTEIKNHIIVYLPIEGRLTNDFQLTCTFKKKKKSITEYLVENYLLPIAVVEQNQKIGLEVKKKSNIKEQGIKS